VLIAEARGRRGLSSYSPGLSHFNQEVPMLLVSVSALLASALAALLGYTAFAVISAGLAQLLLSSLELQTVVALYA